MENRAPGAGRRADLLGRASECALLDGLIEHLRRGESRSLVLYGEAGVGKTALLDYLIESARGFRVARAVGVESEMELAYAGLHQLCGPMLDEVEGLPAPQREALETVFGLSSSAAPDRFLVGLGVLSLLSKVAEQRPLLCVLDDAQWLDQASALTLAFVARRLLAEPVGIVFAAREPGQDLRRLPERDVQGLLNGDARALLQSAVRFKLDERVRDRIIAETRGNPLALLELPLGLTPTQLAGGFGLLGAPALRGRIEESFVRRVEALSDDAQRLLLLAAAEPVGDPLLLWRAAERLDIGPTAADDVATHGLMAIGERVTFRHPLVRSAIYESAPVQERRIVHLALADATNREADPDRRAWHLAAAAVGPDERVASELERSAGRAQARGGLAAAAAFLERAVALTNDQSRRVERALAAAEVSAQAGLFEVVRRLLLTAQAGPRDELRQARVDLLLRQIAMFTHVNEAPALFLQAAKRLEQVDANLARDIYLDAWGAANVAGRLSNCGLLEVSQAAKSAPRPEGPPRASDLLLDSLATLIADGGAAAAPLLEQAARTFIHETVSADASRRWGWMAVVPSYALWDEESAYAICVRQLQTLRDAGALSRLALELPQFVLLAVRCGDLESADAATAEIDTVAEATGQTTPLLGGLPVAAFRGRETEARVLIESVKTVATAGGAGLVVELTEWLFGVLCNSSGRYQEVVAAAQAVSRDGPEEPFVSVTVWTAVELLEAATRSDNAEVARMALDRVVAGTSFARTDAALGILARCRALLSNRAAADGSYQESIERLGHTRLRPELARAHLLYGEWLRGEGRRANAREQLRTAHAMFVDMGMEAFAHRARGELLATGERVRRRTVETPEDLTAQERHIARLVRDGLSNPEIGTRLFLSPRTVEWHLHNVFTKLGISSRKELRDVLPASDQGLLLA